MLLLGIDKILKDQHINFNHVRILCIGEYDNGLAIKLFNLKRDFIRYFPNLKKLTLRGGIEKLTPLMIEGMPSDFSLDLGGNKIKHVPLCLVSILKNSHKIYLRENPIDLEQKKLLKKELQKRFLLYRITRISGDFVWSIVRPLIGVTGGALTGLLILKIYSLITRYNVMAMLTQQGLTRLPEINAAYRQAYDQLMALAVDKTEEVADICKNAAQEVIERLDYINQVSQQQRPELSSFSIGGWGICLIGAGAYLGNGLQNVLDPYSDFGDKPVPYNEVIYL